jgi:hypothetical protein
MKIVGFLSTIAVALLVSSTGARSQKIDSLQLAVHLGNLLASEEFCGLKFDQAAITKFIDENVDATDMEFPSSLESMTNGSRYQQKSMSESQKTAHCRQTTRLSESFGFLKRKD